MLKIGVGKYRGRVIKVAAQIRPTGAVMKKSLFDAFPVEEKKILDVCAGSGAIGLEALSRGAAHVTFIEPRPDCLMENLEALQVARAEAAIHVGKAESLTKGGPFDWIYIDPPYKLLNLPWLKALPWSVWLHEETSVMIEGPKIDELLKQQFLIRKYGDKCLYCFHGRDLPWIV